MTNEAGAESPQPIPNQQDLQRLQEANPKQNLAGLREELGRLGLNDLLSRPQIETAVLARFCEWTIKTVDAAIFRQVYTKPPLSIRDLVENVFNRTIEEVGLKNLDIERVGLEFVIGRDEFLREIGVPLPDDDSNIPTWANSLERAQGVQENPTTGLYEKPFLGKDGFLVGIPTIFPGVQLEIDGVIGHGRRFLRIDRTVIASGVAKLLGQQLSEPLDIAKSSYPQFSQRA